MENLTFRIINPRYKRRKIEKPIETLPNEIWKDINKGYKISNFGRVISIKKDSLQGRKFDKLLIPWIDSKGYYKVCIDYKEVFLHRLIAEAFIPNPNNYPIINHKDENKLNNNIDNLEWCTLQYNTAYSLGIKVKQIDIKTKKIIKIFDSINDAGIKTNIPQQNIYNVVFRLNNHKTAGGYIWRKLDDNDYDIKYISSKKIGRFNKNNELLETYNSITEAARKHKIGISAISNCLRGKSKSSNNYIWKYV